MEFITHVYSVTAAYPKYELYGVVDQIRRAAVAIALNIAEGSGAGSDKEFARFLRIFPALNVRSYYWCRERNWFAVWTRNKKQYIIYSS